MYIRGKKLTEGITDTSPVLSALLLKLSILLPSLQLGTLPLLSNTSSNEMWRRIRLLTIICRMQPYLFHNRCKKCSSGYILVCGWNLMSRVSRWNHFMGMSPVELGWGRKSNSLSQHIPPPFTLQTTVSFSNPLPYNEAPFTTMNHPLPYNEHPLPHNEPPFTIQWTPFTTQWTAFNHTINTLYHYNEHLLPYNEHTLPHILP